jgi:hypothetical protein
VREERGQARAGRAPDGSVLISPAWGGAELEESYPIAPLAHGHALGIAMSTYRATAYLTLHADRRALPDLAMLADFVPAGLATLHTLPHAS